jgi:hypothetical protein
MRSVGDKLVREIARAEQQAIAHAVREANRLGDVPPVRALCEVADHAQSVQARLAFVVVGHDLAWPHRAPRPRNRLAVHDPERAFRGALLDLRHGITLVERLHDHAGADGIFGILRWCDDWLRARRTLVARVAARLAWYVDGIDEHDTSHDRPW